MCFMLMVNLKPPSLRNGEMFILGSSKSDIQQPPKKETLEYL